MKSRYFYCSDEECDYIETVSPENLTTQEMRVYLTQGGTFFQKVNLETILNEEKRGLLAEVRAALAREKEQEHEKMRQREARKLQKKIEAAKKLLAEHGGAE